MRRVATQFGVDLIIDTGDINDWGTTFEARFADQIGSLDTPYVYIRGNHDSAATARAVARQENATVLDRSTVTIAGLTIWGAADPRFTPDKSKPGGGEDQATVIGNEAVEVAADLRKLREPPDIVMVHDPAAAAKSEDVVPLVLAGHRHRAEEEALGSTRLLVEGSTGGAGLRGFQKDQPVPLSCSVLYFDTKTGRLEALDRIEVAGINQADVRIERRVFDPDDSEPRADPHQGGSDPRRSTTTTNGE